MGCLKNRVPGRIVYVSSRSYANAADLRGQRVGDLIAVEVESRDNVVFRWAR